MLKARALLALTLALAGCNESNFTGSSGVQPVAAKPAVDAKPSAEPSTVKPDATVPGDTPAVIPPVTSNDVPPTAATVPTDCGAAGATQARLLTPEIDVTAADAHIEYEIYRTDCDGVVQEFAADKILFDMDAWGAYTDMDATMTQDGTPVPTKLKLTIGSDLFGHMGAGWAHQETATKVAVQGKSKSVRLRIDVAGRQLAPREAPAGGPAPDGSVPIATYLRFGDAAPIQVDVKALHPGTPPAGVNAGTQADGNVTI